MSRHTRRTFLKVSGAVLGGIAAGATVTAAESTDRFIVDTNGVSADDLESAGLELVYDLSAVNLAVVSGAESAVESVTNKYAPDTVVTLDEPVAREDESATDEPLYPLQWDKQALSVPEVHETTRGEGTRVAIIDSGVTATHPDLEHAVDTELSRNFTEDDLGVGGPYGGYHGTHVAGIVAANDRNEVGVVGTAPGTDILDLRVFSPGALASFAAIVAAMTYAAEVGCDAANLSLGAYPVTRKGIGSFYGKVLNRVTTYANSQGTLLVMSAGNEAADLQHDGRVCVENEDGTTECFPAISLPNESAQALSISATGPVGFQWGDDGLREPPESPANYTNYGTNAVDLGAPGGDYDPDATDTALPWYNDLVLNAISEYTAFEDDGTPVEESLTHTYGWVAGTSMAAPQVAAAAALVKSVNPDYSANQVESALERAASVPDGYDKSYYGAGFLDLLGAIEN